MNVKTVTMTILILDSYSLKDKRSVIKSIIHKAHNKFNASIAEVKDNDILNQGSLGLSIVSSNTKTTDQIFYNVIDFIEHNYPVEIVEIIDY